MGDKEKWLEGQLAHSRVLNFSTEYYFFMLAHLFDNLPYNWIRKCRGKNKDCGRYFLNPTERIKEYCNPSCTSRSIQQKKREELKQDKEKYEAYKKKMKKYMKDHYRGKVLGQKWEKWVVSLLYIDNYVL